MNISLNRNWSLVWASLARPVREALSRLAHEGLLYAAGTGRYRVREFTMSDVRDAIELRGVLEGTAARLAAERLSKPEELDEYS